jgi:c-di-GMP-binding flagellar brake protein YcgR
VNIIATLGDEAVGVDVTEISPEGLRIRLKQSLAPQQVLNFRAILEDPRAAKAQAPPTLPKMARLAAEEQAAEPAGPQDIYGPLTTGLFGIPLEQQEGAPDAQASPPSPAAPSASQSPSAPAKPQPIGLFQIPDAAQPQAAPPKPQPVGLFQIPDAAQQQAAPAKPQPVGLFQIPDFAQQQAGPPKPQPVGLFQIPDSLTQQAQPPGPPGAPRHQAMEAMSDVVTFTARVVWSRLNPEAGEFDVGLRFTEVVNALRDKWVRTVIKESGARQFTGYQKRTYVRFKTDFEMLYRTPTGYEGKGKVEDISLRGMQATIFIELPKDLILNCMILTGDGATSFNAKARIARISKASQPGAFTVALVFDELPDKENKRLIKCMEQIAEKIRGDKAK